MWTRRRILTTGAAAVGAGTVGARVAQADHPRSRPEHVTLRYDQAELEQYRPLLWTGHLEVRPEAMYGWIAESPEHDTDVYVYVNYFPEQRGVSGFDSHVLDREPCYVFVNPSGTVDRVLYAAYHWLKGSTHSPPLSDETHPAFEVAQKYHHYLLDPKRRGSFVEIRQLGTSDGLDDAAVSTKFEQWLDTGWEEDLRTASMVNPWSMTNPDVDSWWSHATDEWLREGWLLVSRFAPFDVYGAEESDLS